MGMKSSNGVNVKYVRRSSLFPDLCLPRLNLSDEDMANGYVNLRTWCPNLDDFATFFHSVKTGDPDPNASHSDCHTEASKTEAETD